MLCLCVCADCVCYNQETVGECRVSIVALETLSSSMSLRPDLESLSSTCSVEAILLSEEKVDGAYERKELAAKVEVRYCGLVTTSKARVS